MNQNSIPQFSFFSAPITNVAPQETITLIDVYKRITNNYKENTELASVPITWSPKQDPQWALKDPAGPLLVKVQ